MRITNVLGFLAVLIWQDHCNALTENEAMISVLSGCKNLEFSSPMLRLKRHLFCEYDPTVRPTLSHKSANNVTLKLYPMLVEFDEWVGSMTLHSWLSLTWNDALLTWTPSEFDGLSYIHIKSEELWVPDLSVYNSADMSLDQVGIPSTTCIVYSTGAVSCMASLKYVTRCNTDFTMWPYDKHKCDIHFGSWSHTGEEVNFRLDKKGNNMDSYTNNTAWDLKFISMDKIDQKFKCCPNETYPRMTYKFEVTRHHGVVHSTFVIPAIALMLLTITVLWLPSRSTERLAVASVNLICNLICIVDLHWQLPHNGENPPVILLYYRDSLALAVFALILTALLRKLQDMNVQVPFWISTMTSVVLSNKAGRFLILADEDSKMSNVGILANENEENSDLPKPALNPKQSSWRHFAAIVEWISFFSVVLIYIIIFITLVPSA